MNTLSTRFHPPHDSSARVRALAMRLIAAADGWLAEALERSRRGEQERYLSRARDLYDLERLERQWERRGSETWKAL